MNRVELPGQKLAARDLDGRTAEPRIRVVILDRHTALGIPVARPDG